MKIFKNIHFGFILTAFYLLPLYLAAQTPEQAANWEFDNTVTGNHIYEARDYIKLKLGFSYTPSSSASLDLKLNGALIPEIVYENEIELGSQESELDKSLPVGTLYGTIDVSQTGATNYSIQIFCPPGTAGIQPQLSIQYNSQGAFGFLGQKWNLNGLSFITRVPKTMYLEGKSEEIKLNNTDVYALDGNRLVWTGEGGSVYTLDGRIYRLEIDNYSKIISHGTGSGPTWFEVFLKDGSVIEYGNTNDSKIEAQGSSAVLSWGINKIKDTYGNYITFTYHENNSTGEFWPETINYTGNDNSNIPYNYNTVKFYYQEIPETADRQKKYIAGSMIQQNVLMDKIETRNENHLVKKYVFKYTWDGFSSKLSQILEYAGDETTHYNKTFINWGNKNNFTVGILSLPRVSSNNEIYTYNDFTGDGKTDQLVFNQNSSTGNYEICTLYKNENASDNSSDLIHYNNLGDHSLPESYHPSTLPDFLKWGHYQNTDFSGDGIADMVVFTKSETNIYGGNTTFYNYNYKLHKSTGTGFQTIMNNDIDVISSSWSTPSETYGDFNGDGLTELFIYNAYNQDRTNDGSFKYSWYIENFGTWSYVNHDDAFFNNAISYVRPINFNGNAKTDLLINNGGIFSVYEYSKITINGTTSDHLDPITTWDFQGTDFLSGDFNGDGLTDLLAKVSGIWKIYYSDGKNFLSPVDAPSFTNTDKDYVLVGDYNGDGNDDIINTTLSYYTISSIVSYNTYNNGIHINGLNKPVDVNGYDFLLRSDLHVDNGVIVDNDGYPIYYGNYFDPNNYYRVVSNIVVDADNIAVSRTGWRLWNSVDDNLTNVYEITFNVFYSIGNNLFKTETSSALDLFDERFSSAPAPEVKSSYFYPGDFNGDGKIDLMMHLYNEDYTKVTYTYFYFHSKEELNLVQSITDGFGRVVDIHNEPLTNNNIYERNTQSIPNTSCIQVPLYVTASITTPDYATNATSGFTRISYHYTGAKVHLQGKGFLGFSEISSSNNVSGLKNVTDYEILNNGSNTYFYVPVISSSSVALNTSPFTILSSTTNTNAFVYNPLPSSSQNLYYHKIITPYISQTQTSDNIHNTFSQTNCDAPDEYGNVATVSTGTKIIGASSFDWTNNTENTYDNITIGGKWKLGLINTSTSTKTKHGQSSYIREKEFSYDNNGILQSETSDPSDANLSVTTAYEYYTPGLVKKITTTPISGDAPRYTSFEYDDKFRFVAKKTNNLTHENVFTYESKFGNTLSQTDANGHVTTNEYDLWGSHVKTVNPDGTQNTETLDWTIQGGNSPQASLFKKVFAQTAVSSKTVYYDYLGRELRAESQNFNNNTVLSDKSYNSKGELESESLPYLASSPGSEQNINYTYDISSRVLTKTGPGIDITSDYNHTETIITDNILNTSTSKTTDAAGNLVTSHDDGGNITYTYFSSGKIKNITDPAGNITSMTYDLLGNQRTLTDPDAGAITYTYNGFGEIKTQTDARQLTSQMEYDDIGRLKKQTEPEATTNYTYDTKTNGIGLLATVNTVYNNIVSPIPQSYSEDYTYDNLSRSQTKTINVDGKNFTQEYAYDNIGRLQQYTYPYENTQDKFALSYHYSAITGDIDKVMPADDLSKVIWKCNTVNALGQIEETESKYDIFTLITHNTFDPVNHLLNEIHTYRQLSSWNQDRLDFEYTYNSKLQLETRKDKFINNLTETFTYGNLNRLESATVTGQPALETSFDDATGNIIYKTDLNDYTYSTTQPHAVDQVDPSANCNPLPCFAQDIAYTSFSKVKHINEDDYTLDIIYGPDHQRIKTELNQISTNTLLKRKYFIDNLEVEENADGSWRKLFYINGGNGITAIYETKSTGNKNMHFVFTDHLGSYSLITDQDGAFEERMSYDPWGHRRNPATWTYYASGTEPSHLFDRGFTGHEHLDKFGIINMNGRVYDPIVARFLSPDNFVQNSSSTQSLNRFSYCGNNPMMRIDPSGNFFLIPIMILAADITFMTTSSRTKSTHELIKSMGISAIVAAVGGAMAPIGGAGLTFGENLAIGGAEGMVTGGLDAALRGNDVEQGMFRGAIAGMAFSALTSENLKNLIKGQGFYNNENAFQNMMASDMSCDEILNYFGFEGKYDSGNPLFNNTVGGGAAVTNPKTGEIFYGEGSFNYGYDRLALTANHELIHRQNVLSGNYEGVNIDLEIAGKEEWGTYLQNYKNQGLYPSHGVDIINRINTYGMQGRIYEYVVTPKSFYSTKFNEQWWHFIYRIPRRF